MYKDDYISAFGKLAPSEEWMTDTLAKMRAAEAEQDAPGAAGPAGRPAGAGVGAGGAGGACGGRAWGGGG